MESIIDDAIAKLNSSISKKNKIPHYKDLIYVSVPDYINSENSYINTLIKQNKDNRSEYGYYKFYYDTNEYKLLLKLDDYDFIEQLLPSKIHEFEENLNNHMLKVNPYKFNDLNKRIFNETVDTMVEWLKDEYYSGKNIINYYYYAHRDENPEYLKLALGDGFFIEDIK